MPLLTPDVEPLWIARYDYEPGWQLPPHSHDDYFQLILFVSGEGEALVGASHHLFQAGHLLFLRPRLRHGLTAGTTATVRTLDTKFRIPSPELRHACQQLDSFHRHVGTGISDLLEAILAEARRHGALTNEFCQTLLTQLLLLLLRQEPSPDAAMAPRALVAEAETDLCGRMERFLRENCARKIDQKVLSDALHYSYRHLHGVWLKRHRESPLQSLWAYRVERATHLIRYSDYELKRVAELTGFASVHHFTRVFARIAGIPPARWRDRERGGVRQDIVIRPGFINRGLTIQAEPTPPPRQGRTTRSLGSISSRSSVIL